MNTYKRYRFTPDIISTCEPYHTDAIATHTELSEKRVAAVCRSSVEIHSDPEVENSWRAN